MFIDSSREDILVILVKRLIVTYIDVGPLSSFSTPLLDFLRLVSFASIEFLFRLVSNLNWSCLSVIGFAEKMYPEEDWNQFWAWPYF